MTRETEKNIRSSTFELLRILAMFMIVCHHFVCHGVFQSILIYQLPSAIFNSAVNNFNKIFACSAINGGGVGNSIFFMLTGYFMFKKQPKFEKAFVLIKQVMFYGICLILLAIFGFITHLWGG